MGVEGRGGFQPCALDTGATAPTPRWYRLLVVAAFFVHILDVGLDLLLVFLYLVHQQWGFFFAAAGVVVWAWLTSTCYVLFSAASPSSDDIDGGGRGLADRLRHFLLNFVQWEICAEAHYCVFSHGDADYFHTLRLLEAILQSAPSSLVHLYALIVWAGVDGAAPEGAAPLLRLAVTTSFISVGFSLAVWELTVQPRCPSLYIAAVAVMRIFELASRALTLAVFAGLTHPYGLWWAIFIDYGVILALVLRHGSVQFVYGVFLSIPLVLVGLEPLVWTDRSVPTELYYMVRICEFVLMWVLIIHKQDTVDQSIATNSSWEGCEALALLSTLGLYVTLLIVWPIARRNECSRDVADWAEDGAREGLHGDGAFSDSDLSNSASEKSVEENGDDLPPE